MGELCGVLGLSLSLCLRYENISNAWDTPSGYILQEGMEVKKVAWGKSRTRLCSPTWLPFALKPTGLLHWWNSRCFNVTSL